jgi:hypothetical protein
MCAIGRIEHQAHLDPEDTRIGVVDHVAQVHFQWLRTGKQRCVVGQILLDVPANAFARRFGRTRAKNRRAADLQVSHAIVLASRDFAVHLEHDLLPRTRALSRGIDASSRQFEAVEAVVDDFDRAGARTRARNLGVGRTRIVVIVSKLRG